MKTRTRAFPDEAQPQVDEVVNDKEDDPEAAEEQEAQETGEEEYSEESKHALDQHGPTSAAPTSPVIQPYVPIQPHYAPHYPPYPYYMYPPIAPYPGPHLNPVGDSTYMDFSTNPDPIVDKRRNRGGVSEPFPDKLHRMLDWAEQEGLSDVVSFFPHGRAFAIHKSKRFVAEVMPKFFRQSRLTSFQRQLNLYGFQRINQGPDNGGYYHEVFLKGRPGLSVNMQRTKVKGDDKFDKSEPDAAEPNFYSMAPVTITPAGALPVSTCGDGTAAETPIAPASPAPAGSAPAPASTPTAAPPTPSATAPPPMASPPHPMPPPPPAYYAYYPYPPHPAPYTAAQQGGPAVAYYPYPSYYPPYPPQHMPPNPAAPAAAPIDASAADDYTKGAGEKSTEPVSELAEETAATIPETKKVDALV